MSVKPGQAHRKVREDERLLNDGKDLAEILRTLEISEATWNRWRAQYGGMKASQAKRLKELEAENAGSSGWSPTRRWTSTCSRSWPRETSDPGPPPQGRGAFGGRRYGLP